MMGYTHALTGAAVYLAAAPLLVDITPLGLTAGVVVCAGAAMIPDPDHPSATIARTFGWPTQMLAKGVAAVSGGHRQGTHGLLFAALAGFLVWLACLTGTVGQVACMTLALGLGARSLGWTQSGVIANLTTFGVCALLSTAIVETTPVGWLPVAYTLGCLAHLAGDMCTNSGVPLLWPLPMRFRVAWFTTGGDVEKYLVTPLLTLALLWLGFRTMQDWGAAKL